MDKLKLYYPGGETKEITLASTMDALPHITAAKEEIAGFEVIQGNMDDVFLNAVGRTLDEKGV